ncbi:Protein kinase-like domain protein [Cordyceps fumosorosea ARSEF 2679]|uniref:Protein kinase-like domain protein n=1 Tax=Cordyceps fumosorosea (strain ARSEF 2679) TaxID=1081104 RepID=A0A168EKQ5_CORFA|nr:Protein kinase-like domain protein [Cordyceps fumosorosea ARSEF 2679]OAA73928.1 Protein kinase-like domain protein [Cordyceps fumosorosea ARSEF 2679]
MNVNQVGYDRRLAVIQTILGKFGLKSEAVTPIAYSLQFPWPFNNFIYKVDLEIPASPAHFPGTQPGTTQAPAAGVTALIIRMSNLKVSDLNHTNRVENEVACSALARDALKKAGLDPVVPEIYAWRPPKSLEQEPEEENFGWTICEFKTGKDLDVEFPKLSAEEQTNVILQLADIYGALQRAVIPPAADKFGGLTFDSHGTMVSGQTAMRKGGPWANLPDYWTEKLQAIVDCAMETSFLRTPDKDGSQLLSRVQRFLRDGGVAKVLHDVDATQRCLVHSDFTMNNVLFDRGSKRVTALLDFDFASVNHPIEEHYFASFSDVGGGLRALSPAMYSRVMTDDFERQPPGLSDQDKAKWNTAKSWNAAIVARDILRPKTLPGVEKIEALRRFEESLSEMHRDKEAFLEKYPAVGDGEGETSPVLTVAQIMDAHQA